MKGFTIIELLVVIAIIGILALIILPNYKSGQRQFALERSAHKLAQDIRRAQQMAMSAGAYEGCKTNSDYPSDYKSGWGVLFKEKEPEHYIVFADCNGDEAYGPGADEEVEDIKFEKGVKIDTASSNITRIIFTPPDPTVTMIPSTIDEASIILILENDPTSTKTVKVNKAGLISISD